jgi:hypothetical protein
MTLAQALQLAASSIALLMAVTVYMLARIPFDSGSARTQPSPGMTEPDHGAAGVSRAIPAAPKFSLNAATMSAPTAAPSIQAASIEQSKRRT